MEENVENQSQDSIEPNSMEDILDTFDLEFGGAEQKPAEKPAEQPAEPAQTEAPTQEPVVQEPAAQGQTPAQAQAQAQEQTQAPTQEQKATSTTPTQSPAPGSAPVPSDGELRTLMLQILQNQQALRERADAGTQKPEKGGTSTAGSGSVEDEDTKVFKPAQVADYTFNIPSKLYNGLYGADVSDEERVACLQAFASGIATSVHNRIMQTFGTWTKNQFQAIPAAVDYLVSQRETQRSSQKSIRDDFYGAFPELNKPALGPIIKSTIQAVARETGAKTWSPDVRNKVGTRVRELLAAFAPQVPQAPAPATLTPRAPTPAPAANTVVDPNSPDAIFDVLTSEY